MRHPIVQEDLAFITDHPLPWERFYGKTVLITGANGFLPAYMVETLLYLNELRRGNTVKLLCLVRNKSKAQQRFADYWDRSELELIVQDVAERIIWEGAIHYIIHAASQASPKYYGVDPAGTLKANILGTYHLLELARIKNVEGILFFSSGEVYGEVSDTQFPTKEMDYGYLDPANVRSCYAEGKRVGETMCVSWNHQYEVPTKIVRPFHTYGPGMNLKDGRVFADFVSDVIHKRDIVLKSHGRAVRAFCYLADATTGFFTVLLKGENGHAYNISNDKGVTRGRELANIIASLFPEFNVNVVQQERLDTTGYIVSKISRNSPSILKASQLGWEPIFSIEAGFHRTIRSFL